MLIKLYFTAYKRYFEGCGHIPNFRGTVYGGNDTGVNEWPWIAALIHRRSGGYACGGSLLNSKLVLTG